MEATIIKKEAVENLIDFKILNENTTTREKCADLIKAFRLDQTPAAREILTPDTWMPAAYICQEGVRSFPELSELLDFSIVSKNTENEKIIWKCN